MIRAYTAHTREIDDIETAVAEVLSQIDLNRLCEQSLGILTCYPEFIDTGVVKALCDALPFDVIGCTTMGNATNGETGHLELTLMVLTGDDIAFAAGVSDPLSDQQDAPLRALYADAVGRMDKPPVFIIAFMPLMYQIGGEAFLDILDDVSKLPVFGTLAVDHTKEYHMSRTLHNGEAYTDALTLAIVGGNVKPRFLIESLSDAKTLKQRAIITRSDGHILQEVNGLPVVEYMASLGLTRDGTIEGPSTIPFVIDFGDGTKPVIRAIFAQTPEGYAVCGGVMPVNSTLSIGSLEYADVMDTTRAVSQTILADEPVNALLMFSCVGRNYALGVNTTDEMEAVEGVFGERTPYQLAYSGGEICPLRDHDGRLKNRFHNDTIIACVL